MRLTTPVLVVWFFCLVPNHAAHSEVASPHDSSEPELQAVLLTDFTDDDLNDRWAVVNDNVMGGRSDGDLAFDPDAPTNRNVEPAAYGIMTITGDINTNGGGFTSVRMSVEPDLVDDPAVFPDLRAVRVTLRADEATLGKPLALRLEDNVRRPRGINFRAVLPLDPELPADQWQTITVTTDQLQPTHHGRQLDPSQWAPLDTARLRRVGLILNNVDDGPYRFEIDSIELLH